MKVFFDDEKRSGAVSEDSPANSMKVGFFPTYYGLFPSYSLVLEECTIQSAIKPYLKLKYIPSGKKKRLEPSEIVQRDDGLMQLSFEPVTIKPREWQRLNYVQIKLKETQSILSNITCGTLLIGNY